MASDKKTFDAVVSGGGGTVAFRDLEHLLRRLGFRLARISGSHHIYTHPQVFRPLSRWGRTQSGTRSSSFAI